MTIATLMVNLQAGQPNTHVLAAALAVADRFQATVIGHTACTPIQILYGDGYAYGDVFEEDRKEIAAEMAHTEAEFRDAMGNGRRGLEWQQASLVSSLSDYLASMAGRADLLLLDGAPAGSSNAARQVDAGEVIMQAGRPVLVAGAAALRLERVMVAWKDTREARRAIADALPLLKRASQVTVVEVAGAASIEPARARLDGVVGWLAAHDVAAQVRVVASTGDDAAQLGAIAAELDAGLVVAGAYGHSRVREWALGGVSKALLHPADRASFVSH